SRIVRRSSAPILKTTEPFEINGQVGNVIFAEGLVEHRGRLYLYYGLRMGRLRSRSQMHRSCRARSKRSHLRVNPPVPLDADLSRTVDSRTVDSPHTDRTGK